MKQSYAVVVEPLSAAERAELAAIEIAIGDSLRSFTATGERLGGHLARIRDARLYREQHATFESYVKAKFGMGRARAYQLIDLVDVRAIVSTRVDTPPSERAARELAPLRSEPEALREKWSEAVERHGPTPTAAQVREIVRPEPPPRKDMRFELIEDAVAMLQDLPDVAAIKWPVDEAGDVEVIDEALRWLDDWLPKAKASWKRHKRELREASGARG